MEPAKPHPRYSDMYSEVIVSSSAGKNDLLECLNAIFKHVLSNFHRRFKLELNSTSGSWLTSTHIGFS